MGEFFLFVFMILLALAGIIGTTQKNNDNDDRVIGVFEARKRR